MTLLWWMLGAAAMATVGAIWAIDRPPYLARWERNQHSPGAFGE